MAAGVGEGWYLTMQNEDQPNNGRGEGYPLGVRVKEPRASLRPNINQKPSFYPLIRMNSVLLSPSPHPYPHTATGGDSQREGQENRMDTYW
jgi:hypothetical protein